MARVLIAQFGDRGREPCIQPIVGRVLPGFRLHQGIEIRKRQLRRLVWKQKALEQINEVRSHHPLPKHDLQILGACCGGPSLPIAAELCRKYDETNSNHHAVTCRRSAANRSSYGRVCTLRWRSGTRTFTSRSSPARLVDILLRPLVACEDVSSERVENAKVQYDG
jgi:hypothetical protein